MQLRLGRAGSSRDRGRRLRAHARRLRGERRAADRRRRRALRKARRRSRALRALTSSALALPGLGGAAGAESPVFGARTDYSYGFYTEDELASDKLAAGSAERYEVHLHQFRVEAPLSDRARIAVDLVHETMSGATPWYVVPDTDGTPLQVMTGATVEDARTDVLAAGEYAFDRGRGSASAGISIEKDYLAVNGGLGGELDFRDKNTTLTGGLGFSVDQITPTDADTDPFRPDEENKWSLSLHTGVSQVLGERSVLQSSFTYRHANGFLSDPYKRALVAGIPIGDNRPDTRHQFTWLSRLRHHFDRVDGTLHADYRFYIDDWEMRSHTLDLAWYQSLWSWLRVIPSFRYYSQSQAGFYAPYYTEARSDGLASSDYRLSPFGAFSGRLRAEVLFSTWRLDWLAAVAWERYLSGADFAIGKVELENPGLVDFNLISVSLTARF